jgi:hypothetical protein
LLTNLRLEAILKSSDNNNKKVRNAMCDDDDNFDVHVGKEKSNGRPKGVSFQNFVGFKCTDNQLLELDRLAEISNRDRSYVLRNYLNKRNAITMRAVENLTSNKTLCELGKQGKNLSTLFAKLGADIDDELKDLLVEMIALNKDVRLNLLAKNKKAIRNDS